MQPRHFKRIGLILAVVVCATLTWAAAKPWLDSPTRFSGWLEPFWPALAVTVLASVTGIAFALLASRLDRLAAVLASWATFIVFWRPDIWYVSALPLFVLLWYEASRRIRDDVHDRRKVRINAALGRGVKLILLGAFLMVSVGFYLLPASRGADLGTISEGLQSGLEDAYDSTLVRSQLEQLPPSLQAQFKRDMAEYIDAFVHDWLGPFKGYVPPFLAFALFLALWSVSFIFRELAIWLGLVLWALLKATKFITIEEEDVSMEVVRL